ncbi:N-acyl homoserine lactonase family protein [Streptomyces sp. NPDC001617]
MTRDPDNPATGHLLHQPQARLSAQQTCVERLFVLRLGELDTTLDEMLPGETGLAAHSNGRYRFPVMAYLLDLGDLGWMLVDTGMADGHVQDPGLSYRGTEHEDAITPLLSTRDTLQARLGGVGVRPGQITHVVNTHLHFDHCGNNNLFPQAQMYVTSHELHRVTRHPTASQYRYFDHVASITAVDNATEIVPGVTVLSTPGHTTGHQSVFVRLRSGAPVLLCGDAIPNQDFLDTGNWQAFEDPPTSVGTAAVLLELAEQQGAILMFPHDAQQAQQLRFPPDCYE